MNTFTRMAILATSLLLFPTINTFAADQDRDRTQLQDKDQTRLQLQDREMIYGYDLMTVEERAQHRAKLQSMNTEEEREAYREEHHKLMQARAKERGVEIPELPRRKLMGPQSGMRSGGAGSGAGGGVRK